MSSIVVPPLTPLILNTNLGTLGTPNPLDAKLPLGFTGLRGVFKTTVTRWESSALVSAGPAPPQNNLLTIWLGVTVLNVVIPPGLYSVADLSNAVETALVNAGFTGNEVTFVLDNATQKVLTILNATGVVLPGLSVEFPAVGGFGELLGVSPPPFNEYGPVVAPNTQNFVSENVIGFPTVPYYFSFEMKGGTGKYYTDPGRSFFPLNNTMVDNSLKHLTSSFYKNKAYSSVTITTNETPPITYLFTFPVSISQFSSPTIQRIDNTANAITGIVTVKVESYHISSY